MTKIDSIKTDKDASLAEVKKCIKNTSSLQKHNIYSKVFEELGIHESGIIQKNNKIV